MEFQETADRINALSGKTIQITITNKLGGVWSHVPDGTTHVRFYKDSEWLQDTVIEYYEDYFLDVGGFVDDSVWVHPTIAPIASIGGQSGDDDESFFSDSFAFLFFDMETGAILSATTDDWDFETLTLDEVGV